MQNTLTSDIQLTDVTFLYSEGKPLFENLTCTFPHEKWSSILGPSGVGKSTLLRAIASLENLANGSISSQGLCLSKNVAYMAQKDLLMPWLTVLNNVLIGAQLRGENKKSLIEKAKYTLSLVGLDTAQDIYPRQLSGGMAQRVALARTLMEEKAIILMDEPFSALDILSRENLQALACELLKNKTVIFVTHDPLEAIRVSQHIYVMAGFPATLLGPLTPKNHAPRDNPELYQEELLQLREWLKTAREILPW